LYQFAVLLSCQSPEAKGWVYIEFGQGVFRKKEHVGQ